MNKFLLTPLLHMLVLAVASISAAIAQIPQTINYQGYLTNSASQPVNAAVNVTFRLYTTASGGAPVWQETQSGIGVGNGVFTAVLGSATPLNLPFNVPYFLSLQVNADAEMAGRQPLSSVPYALKAASAETLAGGATIAATQLTGTFASGQFAATQLLPTAGCAPNQFSQWNGAAWVCAAGTGSSTTSDVAGNLTMPNSTASAGNILKGGVPFIHNYGAQNTFAGEGAGNFSMSGGDNTAGGWHALRMNAGGFDNTAHGSSALSSNTTGSHNSASGKSALRDNTAGFNNTAGGAEALLQNITGDNNTATGTLALYKNLTGSGNTASGSNALYNSTGSNNTAIGAGAGVNLTAGNNNIDIGNVGVAGESDTIRIGNSFQLRTFISGIRGVVPVNPDALPVVIDSLGQLGTAAIAGGGISIIATGAGLTGGPITSTGTISLASTQLLPVAACAANQIAQWNGAAWICATGTTGPQGPIGPAGPAGSQGPAGSVNAATNLTLPDSTASVGNILKGALPFIHNFGTQNTFVGVGSGNLFMAGSANTAIGTTALTNNTTGSYNTAGGARALFVNTTGGSNTATGYSALFANTSGSENTAVGRNSLAANTTGGSNTSGGSGALSRNTTGSWNTAIGTLALFQSDTGNSNTAIGEGALSTNATGSNNTAVGRQSLAANATGIGNTAIGVASLQSSTGAFNAALGRFAATFITSGNYNIHVANSGLASDTNLIRIGDSNQTKTFISGIRGVSPGLADALTVVIDSNGQLGTSAAVGGAGGVISITAGTGLTGGTISSTGTIGLAATQLLPVTACASNQSPQWNGAAWTCATGTTGPQGPIGPAGPAGSQGPAGSVNAATNLTLADSTATAGNILKGASTFIHNIGSQNMFAGLDSGNLSMTGIGNTAIGNVALASITGGNYNTASGQGALFANLTGFNNTAIGNSALLGNTTGTNNTASGQSALYANTGSSNTANGQNALRNNTTGSNNIGIGRDAGLNIIAGGNNVAIANVANATDSGVVRIGTTGTHVKAFVAGIRDVTPDLADVQVMVIDSNGQLGSGALTGSQITGAITTATIGGAQLTGTIRAPGNIDLIPSTPSAGNITKNGVSFIHNFGTQNMFIGELAGNFTMTGAWNTASGIQTLASNTTGRNNTASGSRALYSNRFGGFNTASGNEALYTNISGGLNAAIGDSALYNNISGNTNTASGNNALFNNTFGSDNTAVGSASLYRNTTGDRNIAIGFRAGANLTTGSDNINIGNIGGAGEIGTIRIGTDGVNPNAFIAGIRGVATTNANAIPVLIDSAGQLGTASSSRRFKDNIADMDTASSALMQLRPVTFLYKSDQNPAGRSRQYGLIAEEVAAVYPGLVAYSADGQIETVMYQHLPPMLLNEVQKQQRVINAQAVELAQQRARISALEQQSARMEILERALHDMKSRLNVD